VEALADGDELRNRLCVPVTFSGQSSDLLSFAHASMTSLTRRGAQPDISEWSDLTRLNPGATLRAHLDDPRVLAALASLGNSFGPAVANLERLAGSVSV